MKNLYFVIPALLWLSGCGQKSDETKQALSILENAKEIGENMEKEVEKAKDRRQERIDRGDTQAMHYEKLAEFLPEEIEGYEKDGEMEGNTLNMQGMSYSTVSQSFENSNGDKIKITIMDYNAAENMYQGLMAMYSSGIEIDNTDEHGKGFKIGDDIQGWEVFKKKSKDSEIHAGIVSRFYVNIEAENQESTDFAKAILNQLALDDMSEL